jgi:hypothetical protein
MKIISFIEDDAFPTICLPEQEFLLVVFSVHLWGYTPILLAMSDTASRS